MLVKVDVEAPMPLMHSRAAERFNALRERVVLAAGFDFLAVCGDICRAPNFMSNKDGVANRSWHKTGRAFDYNQDDKRLVVVSEPRMGKQFFRTYLRCAKQDGSQGKKLTTRDHHGNTIIAYLFDFTAAAESIGFYRIPAWNGWQSSWNRREFWHYQFDEGLTWEEAMQQVKAPQTAPKPDADKILGLNDRGESVQVEQKRLVLLGFLPIADADGVFGAKTKAAVIAFQKKNDLEADGTIGKQTRAALSAQTGDK